MKKRSIRVLLAFTLCLGLLPGTAWAADTAKEKIQLGDYVQMGTYDIDHDGTAEPILWRCVAFEKISGTDANGDPIIDSTDTVTEYQDGYLPLMLADSLICTKEFDVAGEDLRGSHSRESEMRKKYGSNYWGDGNLRDWLNSSADAGSVLWSCGNEPSYAGEAGFLTNFSSAEKAAMQTAVQKATLAKMDTELEDKTGSEIYEPDQAIATVVQNYSDAYSQWFADTMFLMDTQQLYNVFTNDDALGGGSYYYSGDDAGDLLRTPFYYEDAPSLYAYWSIIVIEYADIPGGPILYVTSPSNSGRGVRPAFYLDPRSGLIGSGSKDAPYRLSHSLTHHEAERPTCTASGVDPYWECILCGKLFADSEGSTEIDAIPTVSATDHTPSQDWSKDDSHHWHTCTVCNEIAGDKESHTENSGVVTTEPTLENEGVRTFSCSVCDQVLRTEAVARLEPEHSHSFGNAWQSDAVCHWHACECGEKADQADHASGDWIIDQAATSATAGSRHRECAVCGYVTETGVISPTGSSSGGSSGSRPSSRPRPSTPVDEPSTAPVQSENGIPFIDVPRDAWYYDAVVYVTREGLFNGTSATTFSPGANMTRSMLVTVLYRAAGSPVTPETDWGSPYPDVDAGAYYGTAVYWARLNGIANGYDNGSFGSDDPITREQLAVMLWRLAGKSVVGGGLERFTDAGQADAWAIDALRWAVAQGILTGRGDGVLDPGGHASRAEVAAMLMRYMK